MTGWFGTWKTHRKTIGKPWENHRKTGKLIGKPMGFVSG